MQNAVSEAMKVFVTVSISFENFDFVVAAFGKTICDRRIKRIDNTRIPVLKGCGTLFKGEKSTGFRIMYPFQQSGFGLIGIWSGQRL